MYLISPRKMKKLSPERKATLTAVSRRRVLMRPRAGEALVPVLTVAQAPPLDGKYNSGPCTFL